MIVDFLECLSPEVSLGNLAHNQDQWHRVLLCCVNGNRSVGGARATADQKHAWLAGQPAISDRHEAGTRLMTTGHDVNFWHINQRIQKTQVAFAWYKKNTINTLAGQGFKQGMTGGFSSVRHGVPL